MSGLKMSVKIPNDLIRKISNIRRDSAKVIATMVEGVFIELLDIAPQYSGNYVANMAIAAGSRMGRKGGELVFSIPESDTDAVAQGSQPAIDYARSQNSGMVAAITANVRLQSGWIPAITIYNRLDYAEHVEAWEEENLRAENDGGAHAIEQARMLLDLRFSRPILYDSPAWHALVNGAKL